VEIHHGYGAENQESVVSTVGVANDVFNGMGTPGLVACHPVFGHWYGLCGCVTRPVAVADRWPIALTPGCSCTVAQSC
jgi:hypothetical protein